MELALFICQNQHMNSHIKIKYLKFDIFKDYILETHLQKHAYNEYPAYIEVSFISQIFTNSHEI